MKKTYIAIIYIISISSSIRAMESSDYPLSAMKSRTKSTGSSGSQDDRTVIDLDDQSFNCNDNPNNDIVAAINSAITQKHASMKRGFFSSLTEAQHSEIVKTTQDISLSKKSITDLCKKNEHFKESINFFVSLAQQNYKNVTVNTLESINDPMRQQPTALLNTIPLPVKQYVMYAAKQRLKSCVDLKFYKDKAGVITAYTICENRHTLAAANKDNAIMLWDLKTGQNIYTFNHNRRIRNISLSPCLLFLAFLEETPDNTYQIRLINLTTKTLLPQYKKTIFSNMQFLKKTKKPILSIMHHKKPYTQTLYKIDKLSTFVKIGTLDGLTFSKRNPLSIYSAELVEDYNRRTRTTDYIGLKVSYNNLELYLCLQAIKNTNQSSSTHIYNSSQYQQLTPFEQARVQAMIASKEQQ